MDSLSGFLQVLNKPVHYFFIGLAVVFFAPDEFVWIGYILLAGVLASIVEFAHSKITARLKDKKSREEEKVKKQEKTDTALAIYDALNEHEKYMVDSCIANNEYVFEGDNSDKKHVTSLIIKGFGQQDDFGRAIVFNGNTFLTVRRLRGKEIKEAWDKKYGYDEGEAEYA